MHQISLWLKLLPAGADFIDVNVSLGYGLVAAFEVAKYGRYSRN